MRLSVSDFSVIYAGANTRRNSAHRLDPIWFAGVIVPLLFCLLFLPISARGQVAGSGSIQGTTVDPSGAAVPNATVNIHNPVSGYDQSVQTDSQGQFSFSNVPLNSYHMTIRPRDLLRTRKMLTSGPECLST